MSVRIGFSEVGKNAVDRAALLLAGFPDGLQKAVKSAIGRTAQRVRSQSSRRIRERYAISASNLRMERNVRILKRGDSAALLFSGAKLPLYRFDGASPKAPTQNGAKLVPVQTAQGWRMTHPGAAAAGHQLRGTAPTRFRDAFVAAFGSGHVGIFERTGGVTASGRAELRELMGSSVPQMIGSEEVLAGLGKDAEEEFDKRMTHEVDAILNGWRR